MKKINTYDIYINWYKIQKEAGLGQLFNPMVFALSLFFGGLDLFSASTKAHVDPKELEINIDRMKGMTNEQKKSYLDSLKSIPQKTTNKTPVPTKTTEPTSTENISNNQKDENKELVNILAKTLYAEAAGESESGKLAVASVIYNRAGGRPSNMDDVVKKRRQFSCWNDGQCKINYNKNNPTDKKAWDSCVQIAKQLANGTFKPTVKYTHYHTTAISPNWSKGITDFQIIGNHKFLNPKQ